MADNTIKIDRAFLERAALRVSQLMLEVSDLQLNLEGYTPSEKFTLAMNGILKKSVKRKISKPLKTLFIIAAILALICACAFGAVAMRKARINYELYDRSRFAAVEWELENGGYGVAVEKLDVIETIMSLHIFPRDLL